MAPFHRRCIGLVWSLTLFSCEAGNNERRWEGEHVSLWSEAQIEPCGGTVEFLDRFASHNYTYWTGEAPTEALGFEVELRLRNDEGESSGATLDLAWAYAQRAVLHELAHLVLAAEDGYSTAFLTEGVAESIGQADRSGQWGLHVEDPWDFVFAQQKRLELGYVTAAQLVNFWVERYGIEAVRAAYVVARFGQTSEQVEQALVGVFGEDLYTSLDDFVEARHCGLQAWECTPSVVPQRALPVTIESARDCREDPDTHGFVANVEGWAPVHRFMLDLSQDRTFIIEVDNATVLLEQCVASCAALPTDARAVYLLTTQEGTQGGMSPWEAPGLAGRYFVEVRPIDTLQPYRFSMFDRDG